eukprot:scaffold1135_cov216-Pinguiococcus_pyrenoidosus.AAC.3
MIHLGQVAQRAVPLRLILRRLLGLRRLLEQVCDLLQLLQHFVWSASARNHRLDLLERQLHRRRCAVVGDLRPLLVVRIVRAERLVGSTPRRHLRGSTPRRHLRGSTPRRHLRSAFHLIRPSAKVHGTFPAARVDVPGPALEGVRLVLQVLFGERLGLPHLHLLRLPPSAPTPPLRPLLLQRSFSDSPEILLPLQEVGHLLRRHLGLGPLCRLGSFPCADA